MPEISERHYTALARIGSLLELIEMDLRYQTETSRELIEAIYTAALMRSIQAAGTTPNLQKVNAEVRTWLDAKYREEHPIP